jgi:guanylate kinase
LSKVSNKSAAAEARRGIVFIVASPSGGGKTTICHRLLESDPSLCFSVSFTSRSPRPGEKDGIDYFFVSEEEFRSKVDRGEFLEWAVVHGHLYGTEKAHVEGITNGGFDALLDIDVQGAESVKATLPDSVRIFILPPSKEELIDRLRNRGTEQAQELERRLSIATKEISYMKNYDYAVINDDLEKAVEEVKAIIEAERHGLRHDQPQVRQVLRSFGLSL